LRTALAGAILGGKKGGPARAKKLSTEELSEQGRKAVMARWAKYRAKKRLAGLVEPE
jgi:hypothetical protein